VDEGARDTSQEHQKRRKIYISRSRQAVPVVIGPAGGGIIDPLGEPRIKVRLQVERP